MELNARPGLAIQIANGDGLGRRLKIIDESWPQVGTSFGQRVDWAMENLGPSSRLWAQERGN